MTITQDILQKMMELPNRAAGSIYEQKAADYLKSVYEYLGIKPKEVESPTIKNSLVNHLILSFGLILVTILVNFLNITILTLAVFALTIVVYFRFFNVPFRFIKKRKLSKRIYAEVPAAGVEKYTLIVTSHYDTSTNLGPIFNVLGPLYTLLNTGGANNNIQIPDYINNPLIVSNLALGITLLALFIPDNSAKFFFGFIAGVPIAIGMYMLNRSKKKLSPGAYDNGVASALLVELASVFTKNPQQNTRIIFANLAAGETLTRGVLPFIKSLTIEKSKTFILDLDCIGEDEVTIVGSEPSYPLGLNVPFDTNASALLIDFANEFFKDELKVINSPLPSANQELIMAGYRVMGIVATTPKVGLPKNLQSVTDTIDKIKWDQVEVVKDFVTAFLIYFDSITREINL